MKDFWYLGSPYSKFPGGIEEAWRLVCIEAARLIKQGIPVYSPIAHTHSIAVHGNMDPYDYTIWLRADAPLMHSAKGLIVLKLPEWHSSKGLLYEINLFIELNKPIIYLDPGADLLEIEEEMRNEHR